MQEGYVKQCSKLSALGRPWGSLYGWVHGGETWGGCNLYV